MILCQILILEDILHIRALLAVVSGLFAIHMVDDDIESTCSNIVESLVGCGINFLAIDFDLTLITEHTLGRWCGTIPDLAETVRPLFRVLVPMAMDRDISVAIVTFSPQVPVVLGVIRTVFPDYESRILIRGNDKSWEYTGNGAREGKQSHMASAAEELASSSPGLVITRNSTLLIDDDVNNIRIALANRVRAVRLLPDQLSRFDTLNLSCLYGISYIY